MVYLGSKARLVKYIAPILQKCIDDNHIDTYIEPFVGGANMIENIKCKNRIGSDANPELIELLKYMQSDPELKLAPDACGFEHYKDVRENRKNNTGKYPVYYTALIGFFASFAGRYFDGGFGRDKKGGREIYPERLRNAREQAPNLKDIIFECRDYKEFKDIKNAVFYFDPPYKDTKNYSKFKIDYDEFYDFVRELSKNNFCFVSEFNMPDDFKIVWEKDRKLLLRADRADREDIVKTERLYSI